MSSPYLSVAEVAKLFGRSSKWVYQRKAEIPGNFKIAGSVFFDRESLFANLRNAATQPAKRQKPDVRNDRHGLLS